MRQPSRPVLLSDITAASRGLGLHREPIRTLREMRQSHEAFAQKHGMHASFVIVEACTAELRSRGAE